MWRRAVTLGAALACGVLVFGAGIGTEACSYDWGFDTEGGASDKDTGIVDARHSQGEDVSQPETSMPAMDASKPLGAPCASNAECAAPSPGLFCRFSTHDCGNTSKLGTCVLRSNCDVTEANVCGCDGIVYSNACDAAQKGQDVSVAACTTPPANTFRCGYSFCAEPKQFCVFTKSKSDYKCTTFDTVTCGSNLDCACVTAKNASAACGGACDDTKVGQVQINCP